MHWKKLALTVPAIFEPIEQESDMFLRAADLREKATTVLTAVKRTPLGRIMEVLKFKQAMDDSKPNKKEAYKWEDALRLVPGVIDNHMKLLLADRFLFEPPIIICGRGPQRRGWFCAASAFNPIDKFYAFFDIITQRLNCKLPVVRLSRLYLTCNLGACRIP